MRPLSFGRLERGRAQAVLCITVQVAQFFTPFAPNLCVLFLPKTY